MNMQSSRIRGVWAFALVVSLASAPAFAGDEAKPEAKQANPDKNERIAQLLAKPEFLFGNDFDARTLTAPERSAIGVFRYERETRKLHQMMLSGLNLTDLQKKAIGKIIEDQIKYAHDTGGTPRPFAGRQRDALAEPGTPNALSTLGDENKAAGATKESAGRPAPKRPGAGGRIRETNRPSPSMFDDPTPLINLLATELTGEQREQFQKLAYRWKVLRPFGASDGLLRILGRSVRDPGLTIEQDQRQLLEGRVQQAIRALGSNRRFADKRFEAYDKTKADVVANLTTEQREHLENTLNTMKTEFAEEVLLIMDMRAKEKGAAANEGKDATATQGEDAGTGKSDPEKPTD